MGVSGGVLALTFGLIGNLISFFVGLAPIPTFLRIYKRKSSEGYQCLPYVISLFSAMLWMYYAMMKNNVIVIMVTINTVSLVIQIFYISIYVFYAPKIEKSLAVKLVLFVDVLAFGVIFFLTYFLLHGQKRVQVVGYVCMVCSLCVFVAPLGIVRKVIKTRSAEFMPFSLSFFLTLSAVMWFLYGFLLNDICIAVPNVLGFILGVVQMVIYLIFKKSSPEVIVEGPEINRQEISDHVSIDISSSEESITIEEKIKRDMENEIISKN